MLAGVLSTIAASLLWPRHERSVLPQRTAEAFLAVAEVVGHMRHRHDLGPALEGSHKAVNAARREYGVLARRPSGLTRRDRELEQSQVPP